MNRLITNGINKHAKRAPVVLGALLAATLTAAAASELPNDTTAQGVDQDTLRSEMRDGAGRAVEETRDLIAEDLALRLLGERPRGGVVAGTDTGKRG